MTTERPVASDEPPRRGVALLVACSLFMEVFDGTVLTTAAAHVAHSFGVGAGLVALPITVYLTTVAALIPVSGWFVDRFGSRHVFAVAVGIFTASSIGCALAPTLLALTLARVLQGVGGALMVPVGRLAALRGTRPEHIMRVIAYLTWPALAAPLLAPIIGGFIATYTSWRWIFVINVPLGAIALLFIRWLPIGRPEHRKFNGVGFVLTATAVMTLTVSAALFSDQDLSVVVAGVLLVCAVIFGFASRWHLQHARVPLFRLAAMRVPTFRASTLGGSFFRMAVNAVVFLVPLLLQYRFGWTAAQAGLYLSALFLGNMVIKPFTRWFFIRAGFRRVLIVVIAGSAVTIAGAGSLVPGVAPVLILVVLFVSGALRSVGFTAYNTIAFADVAQDQLTDANTLFSVVQQLGVGLGVAIAAVALRIGTAVGTSSAYPVAFGLVASLLVISFWEAVRLSPGVGKNLTTSASAHPRARHHRPLVHRLRLRGAK